jgi:ubiquinone/menaquinone biosynthesis C-methylase UbiE
VLVLGCGNAEFSEDMYADGYTNQHNIDNSSVVIEQMKTRNSDKTMKWVVMDVMDLAYPDNFFDAAIDKSTADAVFCGDNSFTNIARMTKEV